MALSSDQLKKLDNWIRSKVTRPCECCGGAPSGWTPGDVVMMPTYAAGNIAIGGPGIPIVAVVCNNCANVRFFAAVPIGIAS